MELFVITKVLGLLFIMLCFLCFLKELIIGIYISIRDDFNPKFREFKNLTWFGKLKRINTIFWSSLMTGLIILIIFGSAMGLGFESYYTVIKFLGLKAKI